MSDNPILNHTVALLDFFDGSTIAALLVIGTVLYHVGKRLGKSRESVPTVSMLAGFAFLSYFFYQFHLAPSDHFVDLAPGIFRSMAVGWVIYGACLLVVPYVILIFRDFRRIYLTVRSNLWSGTKFLLSRFCEFFGELVRLYRTYRSHWLENSNSEEPELKEPTYASSLEDQLRQIKDEYRAEQRVVRKLRLNLDEDEKIEIEELTRQKMLRRIVDSIADEEDL